MSRSILRMLPDRSALNCGIALLALCFVWLGGPPGPVSMANASVVAESTFETGLDGWHLSQNYDPSDKLTTTRDGVQLGYMRHKDNGSGTGAAWVGARTNSSPPAA